MMNELILISGDTIKKHTLLILPNVNYSNALCLLSEPDFQIVHIFQIITDLTEIAVIALTDLSAYITKTISPQFYAVNRVKQYTLYFLECMHKYESKE